MSKRKPPKAVLPLLVWDTAWKLLAIRRAVRLKHYRMIPVLALANTAGLLPMGYLWKTRGEARPGDGTTTEPVPADLA
jgi:hypothetical protein